MNADLECEAIRDELRNMVRGLTEPAQRFAKLHERLMRADAELSFEILRSLLSETFQRTDPLSSLQLDVLTHRSRFNEFGYEKISRIYQLAADFGSVEIRALFRSARPHPTEDEYRPEGFRQKLSALTLGHRRQMSRGTKKRNLELLMFDSSPIVIRELLKNPRMTERDVVRIAARHSAPLEVLEEILKSDRWMRSYRVKKALVFNPSLPDACGLQLVIHLQRMDLRLIIDTETTSQAIRDRARELVQKTR